MRHFAFVIVLLLAGAGTAEARCADEMKDFQDRLERIVKSKPTAQTAAASKVIKRYNEEAKETDEVGCYNALARARRALKAPDPAQASMPPADEPDPRWRR
jgi:hypothetical protein